MANSNIIGTHFATFLNQTIFPGIIQGFARRNVTTSSQELMTMVGGPSGSSGSSRVPTNNVNTLPGVAHFPGASPVANSVVPSISGGRCGRILSKGKRAREVCGKKVQLGSTLCSSCASVGTKTKKAKAGAVEMPEIFDNEVPEPVSINVLPFDTQQGLVREIVHGFILKQLEDRIVVYGRTNDGDTVITALDAAEQQQAQEMGFSIV